MPQDIPYEASDLLAFTPDCLKPLGADAPVFYLRAATTREKKFRLRLLREAMVTPHDDDGMRAETLRGLKALWGADRYDEYHEFVTEYWDAIDAFAAERKDDPDAVFVFDDDQARKTEDLLTAVAKSWPALARMRADNVEYQDTFPDTTVAVTVAKWSGLKARYQMDRGYLSMDAIDELADELTDLETRAGAKPAGIARLELFLACDGRFRLNEDTAKNSASPSPSSEIPSASSPMKTSPGKAGKSRAPARSPKTPVAA